MRHFDAVAQLSTKRLSTFNYQLSIINFQLSTFNFQLFSAAGHDGEAVGEGEHAVAA
jgi:hypothetical protein